MMCDDYVMISSAWNSKLKGKVPLYMGRQYQLTVTASTSIYGIITNLLAGIFSPPPPPSRIYSYIVFCVTVGIEVLTAVVMKSSISWDIRPYSLVKVNQCFGGICCLYLQNIG
jgi:hypothetical protein